MTMPRELPARPNLEHLRRQARVLHRQLRHDDADAVARLHAVDPECIPASARLTQAQHVIAREYGFATWVRLRAHVLATTDAEHPAKALDAAIRSGRSELVADTLARHPELRGVTLDRALPGDPFGATPLIVAIRKGTPEMVDLLLEHGASIHQRSHWWAGGFDVLDHPNGLASFLIARGAVVNAHAAARLGMLDRLAGLIAADPAVVHARGGDGQTPLHVASSVPVAELLLDHGAEIDALDVDHESTPAQYLVGEHPDVARLLVSRGARTDLLLCAALGDLDLARRHLDMQPACVHIAVNEIWFPKRNPRAGGSIYIWTLGQDQTPHALARERGHDELLRLLMERTPPDLALAFACMWDDEPAILRLQGAHPDLTRSLSPAVRRKLADAARANRTDAVRRLLAAGWPVDARGDLGGTALHYAGWAGNLAMTREILRHAPPLEATDTTYGGTPLGWTLHGSLHSWHEAGEHAAVLGALLDAGACSPALDPEPEASEAVLEVLRRRAHRR
jgi:ankyrin repeat protein